MSKAQSTAIDGSADESLDDRLIHPEGEKEKENDHEEEIMVDLWQRYLNDHGSPFGVASEEDPTPPDGANWAGPSTDYAPRDELIKEECAPNIRAGETVSMPANLLQDWKKTHLGGASAPYAPFKSELDWKVADWMVRDSPSQAACDHLLNIPGV